MNQLFVKKKYNLLKFCITVCFHTCEHFLEHKVFIKDNTLLDEKILCLIIDHFNFFDKECFPGIRLRFFSICYRRPKSNHHMFFFIGRFSYLRGKTTPSSFFRRTKIFLTKTILFHPILLKLMN